MPYNRSIKPRRSIRLPNFDYSKSGLYFLTLCCFERQPLFGDIHEGEMQRNIAGNCAFDCWEQIPNHNPAAILHEFIIMPNHVHGIIELDNSKIPEQNRHVHSFQGMIPKSLASIVKGYKIGVTQWFRQNSEIEKVWQRNYYEHIIRNQKAYDTISCYIRDNPK
ncbi:MAG: hypothetical protein EP332_09545 [Bacteroidetes bacterium]|nr:MAG: hypothetical protein EP332_09545 [Bacteroidota bacterium]